MDKEEVENLVDKMILDIIQHRSKIINWLNKGKQPSAYIVSEDSPYKIIEYMIRMQEIQN